MGATETGQVEIAALADRRVNFLLAGADTDRDAAISQAEADALAARHDGRGDRHRGEQPRGRAATGTGRRRPGAAGRVTAAARAATWRAPALAGQTAPAGGAIVARMTTRHEAEPDRRRAASRAMPTATRRRRAR